MPSLHQCCQFPSTTLIFTLFQYLQLVTSQSNPSSTEASLPAASTATVVPSYNFTCPAFPDHDDSGIQVSYKDTIDVSWVENGVQHSLLLQIQCWTRNDTSGFIYSQTPPSFTHDLITSPGASSPFFDLALAAYRRYSPCQLRLLGPSQTNSTEDSDSVVSIAIFISEQTNASTPGVTWSVESPAPAAAVDAGVATVQSGSSGMNYKIITGLVWTLVGVVAGAMVLV
ncbi:hypothetical protein IMSHALPRED_003780 [Imshaugia aleurites]|uniref:Uncharacterized protein n=1 Tax=Imshaugia aleurites TaxID=172621 RepID=A0A8H3F9E3_9LECA|nr:hypothetical protein IMSHALPRED_003780 [Imshaugia aleurites]